jgi:hypothetical protein
VTRATSPRLGLDELVAFMGDRDEAFRLLRRLRIPCCDSTRPVRVQIDRVRATVNRVRARAPFLEGVTQTSKPPLCLRVPPSSKVCVSPSARFATG